MLTKRKRRRIQEALEKLFARAKELLLGHEAKTISIRNATTIPDLYAAAALDGDAEPNQHVIGTIRSVTESYLDAQKHAAAARVTATIDAVLRDAERAGEPEQLDDAIGEALADVWGKISAGVERVVETQAQQGRAMGTTEAISKMADQAGDDDPTVFFITVRDQHLCDECRRLHLLPDGVTPRVWKMSEVGAGYHRRGEHNPKLCGLHPHCRCSLAYLAKGYGFGVGGRVAYISPDHDEFKAQRGA